MSSGLEINLFPETASLAVDIAVRLQERIKKLDLSHEVKQLKKLQRFARPEVPELETEIPRRGSGATNLFGAMYSVEILRIQVSWLVSNQSQATISSDREAEDLVFSIRKVELSTKKENVARLSIDDLQLQMIPASMPRSTRSPNSALLPEVIFNVAYMSTKEDRRLAFQAAGKALDLRLTSDSIIPASILQQSLGSASEVIREANARWAPNQPQTPDKPSQKQNLFGTKRITSLLVDADFAGAVVSLQGQQIDRSPGASFYTSKGTRAPQEGKYGQFMQGESSSNATLRAPAIALKVEYADNGSKDPTLNAEMKIDASSNVLYPTVVPLIMEISSSIKEIVGNSDTANETEEAKETREKPQLQNITEKSLATQDPNTILGRCKLNIGLWICKQEFTLSCKPVARVDATARFDDIYMTINSVQSAEQNRFFALLVTFRNLQIAVKHVYSSEPTASFDIQSIVMSLMNSKHVSNASGLSAILKVSPMKALVNARQLQDFLLFREIWVPPETREHEPAPVTSPSTEPQAYIVQRYQQMASAGAFPWNSTVSIEELHIQIDLGHSIGKSTFTISNLWLSSRKNSDWEQNLCLGFEKTAINCTGRMSGFLELRSFRIRTSIRWPLAERSFDETPLIQASVGFDQLQINAAFDYQAFLVTDITAFEFLMYNVKNEERLEKDRLVAILDGGKVQVFCTTSSASQGLALYQALQRLAQEKQSAYEASLRDIEKYLRRQNSSSAANASRRRSDIKESGKQDDLMKTPISLHTDVVVTFAAVNVGAFPSTFFDSQIFKIEVLDAQARFAVASEDNVTHSGLGLTLGQLRVALANVNRTHVQSIERVRVEDVVSCATGSRGGTILKVPRVVASMQTWQSPGSNQIDYIFKSAFEGKVDVGWNYSRISFIRGMWMNHSRSLASRLGKPLPQSAVQITGGPQPEQEEGEHKGQEKITAVVNVPQSKYEYKALQTPIIETPQLRDMGEATPPLEWIGLHRDKLPNVTHQIIIVTLLEVAKEVEDAYSKILGAS